MRKILFCLLCCIVCNLGYAQITYSCYKGTAALYDPASGELRYYYTNDLSVDSIEYKMSYKLEGIEAGDEVKVDISTDYYRNITVLAFNPSRTSKQTYKVWYFETNGNSCSLKSHFTETFSKAPEFNKFGGDGNFVITIGKKVLNISWGSKSSEEGRKLYGIPVNERVCSTETTHTVQRVWNIEDYFVLEAKREAKNKNKEKEEQEQRDKEAAVKKAEWDKEWAVKMKKEDSLKNLPAGIRIENSTDDLIYCLNTWANQFKDRTDLVTEIASCKYSNSSTCMIDKYKKLKNIFSDLRDRISTTTSKMSSHYTSAWDQCDSAHKYYSKGTNLLDNAYTSFNTAYEAARKIAEQYNTMSTADYDLWVQVMFRSYDEGDVFVQDAYYYLYMGYEAYIKKKCPGMKQGPKAKEGNVLLETLANWQPILKNKTFSASLQRSVNENKRKEDLAKQKADKKAAGALCTNCNGKGVEPVFEKCIICGGDGLTTEFKTGTRKVGDKVVYKSTDQFGKEKYEIRDVNVTTVEGKETVTCKVCNGKGGKYSSKRTQTCHVCNGSKRIYSE